MSAVIRLDDYRKPAPLDPTSLAPSRPRYVCLNCETDRFKLYETGAVHCAHCGARIRNVRVTP